MFQHLNIMVEQLVTVHKSRVRWKQTRETVSWLSKVADKVFGKEKGHTKQETVRRVAFLGDGTFKHKRGYAPVPKKKLAKVLATKGLTITLDEFYTSKQCPCGDSELEDHPDIPSTEDLRIRRHKTSGPNGKCCVECTLGESKMDRTVGPSDLRSSETYLPLQTFCYVSSALWAAKAVRIIFADLGKYIPVDNFYYF
jgi:hypothetical protein